MSDERTFAKLDSRKKFILNGTCISRAIRW